jgi:hypothetical protein
VLERPLDFIRGPGEWRFSGLVRRVPLLVPILIVPSWISYLLIDERDDYDTENLLYFYIPDITEDFVSLVISLAITPLINTEGDQILLVTFLLATFGIAIERRLGIVPAVSLFWVTSIVAAVSGGLILHAIHPFLSHIDPIDEGMQRIFNGGSAGGFGFMGAFAATARWPWLWIGLFLIWEPGFWATVSQDFTSTFHIIAFTTGFVAVRFVLWDRLQARRRERTVREAEESRRRSARDHSG